MSTTGTRILIADDKRATAFTLGKLLESHGHEVRVVLNGLAAMDGVRDFQPRIVLLDIGMPGMDGHEVTQQIRREFGNDSMVVAIISGHGEEADKALSRRAGANYHLTKPINFDDLWAIVNQASEDHQQV